MNLAKSRAKKTDFSKSADAKQHSSLKKVSVSNFVAPSDAYQLGSATGNVAKRKFTSEVAHSTIKQKSRTDNNGYFNNNNSRSQVSYTAAGDGSDKNSRG